MNKTEQENPAVEEGKKRGRRKAAEVETTATAEAAEAETEHQNGNGTETGENGAAEIEQPLYGAAVTAENLSLLAGVPQGVFPLALALSNNTPSVMALPELGTQLEPYAQDVHVSVGNAGSLNTFINNYACLYELLGWNDKTGIFVKGV